MKILIDINHPAHVHYFKDSIQIMKSKEHQFLIISRNKEIEHYLLKKYNIEFLDRGIGSSSKSGKFFYFFKAISFIIKQAIQFKPNIIVSFGTPYPAISSKLLGIPHISFYDSEHAKMHQLLTNPFSKTILNPSCYKLRLGEKQILFKSYMELCYLHPSRFIPDSSIYELLKLKKNKKYFIVRFVSWNAIHDVGQKGFDFKQKIELIEKLSEYGTVFISSEGELPENLKKHKILIPPEKMHDALAFATLFIGEGATMASECAMLSTPAIYVNSLPLGYIDEQAKNGLLYSFRNSEGVLEKVVELLKTENVSKELKRKKDIMLKQKIDATSFIVWFLENYPRSVKIMKDNPNYQDRFLN